MSSGVRNIAALEELSHKIGSIVEVLPDTTAELAPIIAREIEHEFDMGTDPYGQPWAPLAPSTIARGRHHPPLTDSGEMRGSVDVQPTARSITISIDSPYEYHQEGDGSRMPARKILPEGTLPQSWVDAADEAAQNALAKKFGGDL